MSFHPKILRFVFTLAVIAGVIFLAHQGYCYYEDPNEDGYCVILMRGDFTGGPQTLPNTSGFWTGLTYPVKALYTIKGDADWYGIFMTVGYGLLLFQIAQILPFIYSGLKKITSKWVAIVVICISAVLFSENLFLWQLTRLSLLLSGISFFKIWLNLNDTQHTRQYKWASYVFNVLCFSYAAFIRSEPAAVNFAVWLPLVMLDYINGTTLKKYVAFVPLLVVIGIIAFITNTPTNQADSNYLAFRKYQFSFFDYKQPAGTLNIRTAEDSMIYAAATTAFLSDSAKLNTAYFKRIGMMPMDKTPSALPYYFRNLSTGPGKIKKAWSKIATGSPAFLLFYWLCFLVGMVIIYITAKEKMFWYLLSQLWPVILFLGITTFMKMENRVLVPMMWCFLIQNLVWCFFLTGEKHISTKLASVLALIFVFVGLAIGKADTARVYNRWKLKQYEEAQADKLMQNINTRTEKIIVVNDNACSKLAIRPFKPRYVFTDKKIVCLNYFQLFWLAGYGPYMESVCGKSDLPGIVKALYEQKNNVLFISKPARMEMIKDYFGVLYHFNLPYTAVDATVNTNSNLKNSEAYLYRFI